MIEFKIPWPPTHNEAWKPWRSRMVLSEAGKTYRELVGITMGQITPLDAGARYGANLGLSPPCQIGKKRWGRRRWDIDNRIKPVLDALESTGFLPDDRIIRKLLAEDLGVDSGDGSGFCLVSIWELEGVYDA